MSDKQTQQDPLVIGREVIEREAEVLSGIRLGDSFRDAVEMLEGAAGRIIVTGVGKSGLVGAKIAATLTSVGSPSFFLHPTEALHGDLGIVGDTDVVLVISKSGRSAELLQLLPHFKRVGTPIIGIMEVADCPLGRDADVVIELGRIEEACSLNLVPTCSTTAALAVGDALAVAMLRRRGITPEDLSFVHPGGVIGRIVTRRVGELMKGGDALPVLDQGVTLREALVEIVEKGLGVTTLVDADGDLAGVLTDGDLKRILLGPHADHALAEPVNRFMNTAARVIEPDALIAAAVREMEERRPGPVTCLVVVDAGKPVGILHLHDCLQSEAHPPNSNP